MQASRRALAEADAREHSGVTIEELLQRAEYEAASPEVTAANVSGDELSAEPV